jgi:hypothetical protein
MLGRTQSCGTCTDDCEPLLHVHPHCLFAKRCTLLRMHFPWNRMIDAQRSVKQTPVMDNHNNLSLVIASPLGLLCRVLKASRRNGIF